MEWIAEGRRDRCDSRAQSTTYFGGTLDWRGACVRKDEGPVNWVFKKRCADENGGLIVLRTVYYTRVIIVTGTLL